MQENIKNDNPSFDAFLDVNQTAAFLGIAKATLYGKCSKQLIPHFKKGKKLYLDQKELIQWLKSGKRKMLDDIQNNVHAHLGNR
jgi:predicted DNA-binding transcriptional regulator AlpA